MSLPEYDFLLNERTAIRRKMVEYYKKLTFYVLIIVILLNIAETLRNIEIDQILQKRYDFKDAMRQQVGGKFVIDKNRRLLNGKELIRLKKLWGHTGPMKHRIGGINDPKSSTGEYPVRPTEVKPFYMDIYPVTVAQFWKYKMKKTRYKTTAEKHGYSWVLSTYLDKSTKERWSSESADPWWMAVKGAQWNRPEGPSSHVRERLNHPVVHVSYYDAKAFCQWMGKRLPTEEEWEFAARGPTIGVQYPWGDKFKKFRMNTWQGTFPDGDKGLDGWKGLSPVDAFPAQNNNSMFDMLGNVWEWTSSRYYERVVDRKLQDLKYVLKGGSYMDSRDGKINYVVRTANRMGQPPDYTAHNIGFRCAASAPHLVEKQRKNDPRYQKNSTTTRRPPKLHRKEEMAFPPPSKKKTRRKFGVRDTADL